MSTLISSCDAGLGNRLCVHAGSLRIARQLGRRLLVHWPLEPDEEWPLRRLFRLQGIDEYQGALDAVDYDECAEGTRFMAIPPDDAAGTIRLRGYAFPFLEGERPGYWDEASHVFPELSDCLRSFQPVRSIWDAAAAHPLPPGTVGVHWRTGRGLPPADRARFGVSQQMQLVRLMRESGAKYFYVAADVAEVSDWLPGQVVPRFHPSGLSNRSFDHIRDALIENLILSRCDAIIGTNGSYYSVLAALWRNVPLVIARESVGFGAALAPAAMAR